MVSDFFGSVKQFAEDMLDALKLVFNGILEFITGVFTNDWDLAWKGVKDIFKGVVNGIITLFEGMLNSAIGGFNRLALALRAFTAFKLPDWMGGYQFDGFNFPTIPAVSLPRLATGAVIPPNREFMAILGDQNSGTNIEAPLDTIVEAFRQVQRNQKISVNFNGTLAQLIRAMNPEIEFEQERTGASFIK